MLTDYWGVYMYSVFHLCVHQVNQGMVLQTHVPTSQHLMLSCILLVLRMGVDSDYNFLVLEKINIHYWRPREMDFKSF